MENKKEKDGSVIRRVSGEIFEKFLQETPKNQLLVGTPGFAKPKTCYVEPHEFRRYFDFSKENFLLKNQYQEAGFKKINSTELFLENFESCSIKVKVSTIEINYPRKWHVVDLSNLDLITPQLIDIIAKTEIACIEVLKNFIKTFGGFSELKVLNYHENLKVMGEDFIDKIPLKAKFRTEVVKKVYNEKNIEFLDSPYAAQYLTSRALEDITPPIISRLDKLIELTKGKTERATPRNSVKTSNDFPSPNVQNLGFSIDEFNFMLSKMKDVWMRPDYFG